MIDLAEPNNKEAEEKLISCLCIEGDSQAYDGIASRINGEDFYYLSNRLLFQSIAHLSETQTPIDEVSIMEHLKSIECLEEVDGVSGIMEVLGRSASGLQMKYYTDLVLEKSKLRTLRRTYLMGAENASTETAKSDAIKADVDDQLGKVMEVIDQSQSIKDSANELKEDFTQMLNGEFTNDVTSCGKSALALFIALKAVRNDAVPTLIFSLEMPQKQITKRMVQCVSGRNVRQIQERVITDANMQKVNDAIDEVSNLPIYTAHTANSPQDIVSQTRTFVKKHGVKLVLIDYLQLIPWSRKANSKAEGIADISHKIKQMALELNISVILLSQVNREGAKRETGLSLYDLKDSGDIENDADIVLLLWPKNGDIEGAKSSDSKGPYTDLQYTIAKNREGERGVGGYLKFYHCLGRFQ